MSDKTAYIKTALTGGTTAALDGINGTSLLNGDVCDAYVGNYNYKHVLSAASGATASSPNIIAPVTNAGTKRWILQSGQFGAEVKLNYSATHNASLAVGSDGNLTIDQTGAGVKIDRLQIGNYSGWFGGNLEIINLYHTYSTADLASNPDAFEIHSYWTDATPATSGNIKGAVMGVIANGTGTIQSATGIGVAATVTGTSIIATNVYGTSSAAIVAGTGNAITNLYGVWAEADTTAGNTATNVYGVKSSIANAGIWGMAIGIDSAITSAAGTVTDFYGFKLETIPAGPTITNVYGLYLPDITQGVTLNYALYSAGGNSYHAGNIGVGALPTLTANLRVSKSYTDPASITGIVYDGSPTYTGVETANEGATGIHSSIAPIINTGHTNSGSIIAGRFTHWRNFGGVSSDDAGTLTSLKGVDINYGHFNVNVSTAPITTSAYGIYMAPSYKTGTITNLYDIYIGADTTGGTVTNRWGIYQANTGVNYFAGNVSINNASPAANLILDLTSTTKAFAPPRMTSANKSGIASPSAGMVVYDTDLSKLCMYNGAQWQTVTSAP